MPPANPDQKVVRRNRKVRQGVVVSDKMDKSIMVRIERTVKHPLYKKVVRRKKSFMAHDEKNDCHVGDVVKITECRPLSRRKRWRLLEIITREQA